MNKPFIIGISAFAAALGYFLFKGTSLKETGDNIRVSLASLTTTKYLQHPTSKTPHSILLTLQANGSNSSATRPYRSK
jgi:hypothetical protein